jgi:histidinol-phosphatase (PHP family)
VIAKLKSDISRARETFGDRLEISMGLELGEAHHDINLSRELALDGDIDFIIGSLHHPRNAPDYYHIDYDHISNMDEIFRVYFDELMEMVRAGCFDVIGHMNYQMRYMSASARSRVDMPRHYGRIREILREIARAGKGIEINTSGLWRGLGFTLPSAEVVKMFREEGGEIVTTGSDAHRLEQLGGEFERAVKSLAAAGFEKFAFFKKRTPHFHDV